MTIEQWHYGCPMGETYVKKDGSTVSRRKNLRGLLDYARVSPVAQVESRVDPLNSARGELKVTYADDAIGYATFASYHIMIDWIRNRRSWRGAKHVRQGPDMGYLTIPGTLVGTIKTVRDHHIDAALCTLNAKHGKSYPDIGYSYYADIKGDGRNMRQVYTIISEGGGVTRSHMNGATMRKTLTLIEAEISKA